MGDGDVCEEQVKAACTDESFLLLSVFPLHVVLGYWSGGSLSNSLVALSHTGKLSFPFLSHLHPPMSKMESDV